MHFSSFEGALLHTAFGMPTQASAPVQTVCVMQHSRYHDAISR